MYFFSRVFFDLDVDVCACIILLCIGREKEMQTEMLTNMALMCTQASIWKMFKIHLIGVCMDVSVSLCISMFVCACMSMVYTKQYLLVVSQNVSACVSVCIYFGHFTHFGHFIQLLYFSL